MHHTCRGLAARLLQSDLCCAWQGFLSIAEAAGVLQALTCGCAQSAGVLDNLHYISNLDDEVKGEIWPAVSDAVNAAALLLTHEIQVRLA